MLLVTMYEVQWRKIKARLCWLENSEYLRNISKIVLSSNYCSFLWTSLKSSFLSFVLVGNRLILSTLYCAVIVKPSKIVKYCTDIVILYYIDIV